MARCYSGAMARLKPPSPSKVRTKVWIISDARNDAGLERALAKLPRGSGLIFRHYHLSAIERRARFAALARLARRYGHVVALAGDARTARRWGADLAYGSPDALAGGPALPRLVTVHSLHELARARRADAVLLSPVFATRSHPGARALGPLRFLLIAAHASAPVIALGGMNARAAHRLKWPNWAAIDAFCGEATRWNPADS
ncbi:MAG: thiamine phosphate synthase [Proteobacteria bacterium]|nr:thiamine phosphate synthase [Pseudomonadota bacterium]